MSVQSSIPERVAYSALQQFDALPQKCKPRMLQNGTREWTPMSAVVVVQGSGADQSVFCVSLATGTKCLASTALSQATGSVLHDSHAEILACRGFNHWLLSELHSLLEGPEKRSEVIQITRNPASRTIAQLKEDISIHLFSTEAPCGDASMELLIASKPPDEAFPWSAEPSAILNPGDTLLGRGHFSVLGAVRRKPARADAEQSLSKSCTDKLTIKQFTSLLAFPCDLFVARTANAFIESLVTYNNQYNQMSFDRAFGPTGRLTNVIISSSTQPRFFETCTLPADFPPFSFCRKTQEGTKCKASNISTIWIRGTQRSVHTAGDGRSKSGDVLEVLVNGVKQGYKQFESRRGKESVVCRRRMWEQAQNISSVILEQHQVPDSASESEQSAEHLYVEGLRELHKCKTYEKAKSVSLRSETGSLRHNVKDQLRNWIRNRGDDEWSI